MYPGQMFIITALALEILDQVFQRDYAYDPQAVFLFNFLNSGHFAAAVFLPVEGDGNAHRLGERMSATEWLTDVPAVMTSSMMRTRPESAAPRVRPPSP